MKNITAAILLFLVLTGSSCQLDNLQPDPIIIVDPPFATLIGKDSITSGNYLGIGINEEAQKIYSATQSLGQTDSITHINIVSNFSVNLADLQGRIPLYDYIVFDEAKGTDSGVQLSFESGKVKSIYLNSGKSIKQWPSNSTVELSVRIGDRATDVYPKLVKIRNNGTYAHKFERLLLATKTLSTPYDVLMARSPQWYFVRRTGAGLWELIKIHFKDGKVLYIEVDKYRN
ncbi:hypothetical protein [Dyadobacter psychrotolerans]|uniref:NigD-like C-terminal beta sandwich domain-containing protein n=1 Tax=Dyadobacter psychrotolerans TaxID=2541721 RepID=A0A4R5DDQ9_9BACT|nr:hypothetical protein [Dyadobacter psychrotolerans]TDE11982.1 hypothetical protein E0F88_23285 [Dyadobacter psychrotolerans]